MNQQQSTAYQAMLYLKKLCEENNISYYLLAGSTLGAVRHGGFIPWDDDIDVGIKLCDLNNLERILCNIPEPYKYVSQHNNATYPRLSGKILCDGRNCIDIFPLVKISDNSLIAKMQWNMHKIMMHIYFRKISYEINVENKIVRFLSKVVSPLFSRNLVVRIDDYFLALCEKKETKYYCNITSKYSFEKEKIKSEWLKEISIVVFEGTSMSTVCNTDAYLTKLYGDYMKLPPVEDRVPAHEEKFNI